MGTLQESFWALSEKVDLDVLDTPQAFDHLIKLLDVHFKYETAVEVPDKQEKYFSTFMRKKGETLQDCILCHDQQDAQLEQLGVMLPALTRGWHLLQRAAIPDGKMPLVRTITKRPRSMK